MSWVAGDLPPLAADTVPAPLPTTVVSGPIVKD
jgi:hypothetical protein